MASFLLELFSEEIPARMQKDAATHLELAFSKALEKAALTCGDSRVYVTARRLALLCENIPTAQPDVTIEKKGPRASAPQAAIDGFVRSSGVPLEKLEKRLIGSDETYFAVIHHQGQPTSAVLKAAIQQILTEFPWPKSMRWGSGEVRWVRPLHSILCLFDGHIVPVEFGGITASNVTYGHRFLAPAAITVQNPQEYAAQLKKAHVLADAEERKAAILESAETLAKKHDLNLKADEGLLQEVTGLVEWPTVLTGAIDKKYMDLPTEVLVSEMRAHQKYFALPTKAGTISDKFLIVSNMATSDDGKAVVAGNERVLRARLADGRFFWDQDRKKPLSEWAKGLAGVTFHAKIGTMAEKVERVKKLAVALIKYVPAADKKFVERAAQLCKADLVTGMVGEFPELQGVMGRYYALHQKEEATIANAMRDHYLPLGPDSPVPGEPVSICVALADKLDTLISMFAADEKPTGSKDPFALRRSALGIIRIVLENNLRVPLKAFLNDELIAFFSDRLKVQLKDKGIRHDLINAVMANGDDDLLRVVARAKALQEFLSTPDGINLLAAYRRAGNIVTTEEKKYKRTYTGSVKPDALSQDEERELFTKLTEIKPRVIQTLKEEKFSEAMAQIAILRKPVDIFFDRVMVNTEEEEIRTNRLYLLASIRAMMAEIADFALIEG